ncbi:hypothetical protein GGF46_003553 [Coemansia sp. RSA 552]|nr:hypothetical protein GGF46_003553 [Coemansia sp. RSA 552]
MSRRRTMDLAGFLDNAPSLFGEEATLEEEIDPDIARGTHQGAIRRFSFDNGDTLSCIRWDKQYHITSTDIIRALVHRFEDIQRPVLNIKKFEEGVFSDLRCLKPGIHARLELPRSEFLELLYKHHCVRTQKKQKVFFWSSVPHDLLFREALERDLKREAMGLPTTTKITKGADPAAHVVIGGVELPLSVPPTLAAHLCKDTRHADGSSSTVRVSTTLVTSAAVSATADASAATASLAMQGPIDSAPSAAVAKGHGPDDGSGLDSSNGFGSGRAPMRTMTPPLATGLSAATDVSTFASHNQEHRAQVDVCGSNATQPSLVEYISGRAAASSSCSTDTPPGYAPLNDGWTGSNFQALRSHASRLHTDQGIYQTTPTPHHSPKESAANDEDILKLLVANRSALVTADNVDRFNALLDRLISGPGQMQESTDMDDNSPPSRPASFGGSQISQSRAEGPIVGLSASSGSVMPGHPRTSAMCIDAEAPAMLDSIASSASIATMATSRRISPNRTPEASGPQMFGHIGDTNPGPSMQLDGIDGFLGAVDTARNAVGATMPLSLARQMAPEFTMDSYEGLQSMLALPTGFEGLGNPDGSQGQYPMPTESYTAPFADTRMAGEEAQGQELIRQPWLSPKPSTQTPRSTRFSRYHPYLKTMARIAHRGSPSVLNRVPSTADPNVAAAAVNALAGGTGYSSGAGTSNGTPAAGQLPQGSSPASIWPLHSQSLQFNSAAASSQRGLAGQVQPFGISTGAEAADSTKMDDGKKPSKRRTRASDDDSQPRRFHCTFAGCIKQFKRHEHLKRHFRTHTGERPYKCSAPDCGKVFARMDNLNQHIRTHVNRKTASRRGREIPITSKAVLDANGGSEQAQMHVPILPSLARMPSRGQGSGSQADPKTAPMLYPGAATAAPDNSQVSAMMSMVSASGGTSAAAGPEHTGAGPIPATLMADPELAQLSHEWYLNALSRSGPEQGPEQEQESSAQSIQSPLMENNAVAMLRKISKSNRTRVGSGSSREDPQQLFSSYGPGSVAGPAGEGSSASELMRTLSIESTASSFNPVWLASFMPQTAPGSSGSWNGEGSLLANGSGRPVSLKRHLDDIDEAGGAMEESDSSSGGGGGDGHRRLRSSPMDESQSAPVTGSVGAKFVRAGIRNPHTLPV